MQLPRRKVWHLAGESQINEDGTPRQRVLSALFPGEALTLRREPDNPHDGNAIAVMASHHVIGYVPRDDAAQLAPLLDAGESPKVQLHQLTGGTAEYPLLGATICIAWRDQAMLTPKPIRPDQITHASLHGDVETAGKSGCLGFAAAGLLGAPWIIDLIGTI